MFDVEGYKEMVTTVLHKWRCPSKTASQRANALSVSISHLLRGCSPIWNQVSPVNSLMRRWDFLSPNALKEGKVGNGTESYGKVNP